MYKSIVLFALLVVFASCNNGTSEKVNPRQEKLDSIKTEESKLVDNINQPVNSISAEKLMELYLSYIKEFPSDSMSTEFMFKRAEILMNIQREKEAIQVLDSLILIYPESSLVPVSLHLKGFIWDDKLKSPEMARICFEQLVQEYPEHQLAQNAKDYLMILGMTPEEIIEKFDEKNSN